MVAVSYKSRKNMSYMIITDNHNNDNKDITDISEYIITKKYKFSPIHNGDTPYNPDWYYNNMKSGHNEKYHRWCSEDELTHRRGAIIRVLHLMTNYNQLVYDGFYNVLSREQIYTLLKNWYNIISNKFPKYRAACEAELVRHMTNYDLGRPE
jgi:hypothetical protein